MEINFFSSNEQTPEKILSDSLRDSKSIKIAVAYLTKNGLDLLNTYIKDKTVRIICGADGFISDLVNLNEWCKKRNYEGRVYVGENKFHLKMYIIEDSINVLVIVGSFNLTGDGLTKNQEIGAIVKAPISDEVITRVVNYFNELWQNNTVEVGEFLRRNPSYRKQYRSITKRNSKLEKKLIKLKSKPYKHPDELLKPILDRKRINDTERGVLTAVEIKGHRIRVAHLEGYREHRVQIDNGEWKGGPGSGIQPEKIEALLNINIPRKQTGREVGYPTKSSARAVWDELRRRYNVGDPGVLFIAELPEELMKKKQNESGALW